MAAIFALSGERCAYISMYPIATSGERLRDSSLVGMWTQDEDTITVIANSDSTYRVTVWQDSAQAEHSELVVTRISGKLFMQTHPADKLERRFDEFLPVFTLARLEQIRPALVYRGMDGDWLHGLLTTHPNAVHYLPDYGDFYVFTERTPALRAFLGKYASEARAWRKDSAAWTYVGPPREPR